MSTGALRRARSVCIALMACGLFAGGIGATYAWLDAEATNAGSSVAAGWIGPATGLSASYSRYNVTLAWTNATTNVNSQTLLGYDAGTTASPACPARYSTTYATTITTIANNTTHTYADTNRGSGINGHNYCYELLGNSATYTTWKSAVTLPTIVGMAATGLSVGTGDGNIANSDTITITWNQRSSVTTNGTANVCAYHDGTILVGVTLSSGNCPAESTTPSLATLTGATSIGPSSGFTSQPFANSTVVSTTTAPYTTTITLKNGATSRAVSGSSWTLTPSSSVTSNATPAVTVCATGGSCTPSTTTQF